MSSGVVAEVPLTGLFSVSGSRRSKDRRVEGVTQPKVAN